MPMLRITSKPTDLIPPEEILETLLVETGTAGELPTDEKKLLKFLGLQQLSFDFMHELNFLETPERPLGELRAAIHFAEKVIATQTGMGEKRTRFALFHEVAHCVLPEHNESFFVDTDHTLSWWSKVRFEREANRFAADLLFQGKLFSEEALSLDTSIKTVLRLAPKYGASYEAALRRYTEDHVMPCALIVFDKVNRGGQESYVEDDEYKIHYTITSSSFRKQYFSGVQLTESTCKASELYAPNSFWTVGQVLENESVINNEGKEEWRFNTEVFSNGYKIFQFLKKPVKAKN